MVAITGSASPISGHQGQRSRSVQEAGHPGDRLAAAGQIGRVQVSAARGTFPLRPLSVAGDLMFPRWIRCTASSPVRRSRAMEMLARRTFTRKEILTRVARFKNLK